VLAVVHALAGRADSARRRERVLKALSDAGNDGEEITVSGIAGRAGVDRTFLYRHRDLLEQVHAAEAQPPSIGGVGPAATRASLQSDLLAAQHRCARMTARTQQLETRLSELLGRTGLAPGRTRRPGRHRATQTTHRHPRIAGRRPPATTRGTRPRTHSGACRQP
jgi:hypothetical protein